MRLWRTVRLSFVQPLRRFAPAPLVGEPLAKRRGFAVCPGLPSVGATTTTAASGGNRESLLGPRPAGCEARTKGRSRCWEPQPGQWHAVGVTERFSPFCAIHAENTTIRAVFVYILRIFW